MSDATLVGADGCKGGWVAVIERPGAPMQALVFGRFSDLVEALPETSLIAVDMPIGLPDFTRHGGRGPEGLVRPLLGMRQSSVFSIPSRAAVYADTDAFTTIEAWYDAHRRASAVARQTSDPSRAISIQAFGIFAKIRELDTLLRTRPGLAGRMFESHPEVAFWRLNGEQAMSLPKKVKGRVNPPGMAERKALLAGHGVPETLLDAIPRGAGEDDLLDAAAMCLIARRIQRGEARPFPDPPGRDAHHLPIAIWC